MHRSHALAALLAAAALLGGCKQAPAPTAAPATKAPATPAATPHLSRTARLEAFVRTRYGDKASLSADWAGEADGFKANSQVCAEQPAVVGEQVQQLLAVCHSLSDGGHGNPGLVDFFVLRGEGEQRRRHRCREQARDEHACKRRARRRSRVRSRRSGNGGCRAGGSRPASTPRPG